MPSARLDDSPIARAVEALGDTRAFPDVEWLVELLEVPASKIEAVLREAAGYLELEETIHARHAAGGRDFYAQFRAPLELYALTRFVRPAHIIETGVSSGVSSAHFLLALRSNAAGTLHSIDYPISQRAAALARGESPVSLPPGRTSGWAIPDELRKGWDLRVGPSQDLLPALVAELPSVDFFLHDSHHTPTHLAFELATIQPKLSPGAIVLADNTSWTGRAFDRFARGRGVSFFRRGGTDLVGLRIPGSRLPEVEITRSRSVRAKPKPSRRRR